eukprot:2329747-Ditylum_brightwellii.AAC.1
MFESDTPLFARDLKEMMTLNPAAKQLWLQAVAISFHDYKVIHKRRPTQHQITQFFTQQNMETNPQDKDLPDKSKHAP